MSLKKTKRRDFLANASMLGAGYFVFRQPLFATAIDAATPGVPFTMDNRIDSEWLKSLYQRGKVTTYLKSKNELQYIGMPVGGINCGTLYLGGDGKLWLWDIFNTNQEGIEPKEILWEDGQKVKRKIKSRDGACYVQPAKDIRPLEQGFAIRVKFKNSTIVKRFHTDDWAEISFEATYPIANIHYSDPGIPVTVRLSAFSPFIPLDEINSNIPVTIQSFEIINNSSEVVEIEIIGWLENAVNKFSATLPGNGKRINAMARRPGHVTVSAGFEPTQSDKFKNKGDSGSMCLSFIGQKAVVITDAPLIFSAASFDIKASSVPAKKDANEKLIGAILTPPQRILPSKKIVQDFAISWHFPNVGARIDIPDARSGHFYTNKFKDALAVSDYVAAKSSWLIKQTKLWSETWFDSSLPWWLLERTFLNISTLATTTSHRFKTGRSWAWEGVGACEGNCLHVWQYAQSVARIFPAIERDNRQRVDLGLSLMEDGGIWFRGEYEKRPAIDGQAGTVLRIYREHQMSSDDTFLKKNWTNTKRAIRFLLDQDRNKDGMEDTPMENTLDAVWDGEIAWIVGLCIAAVKAGETMADEMGDDSFALLCRNYITRGRKNMEEKLFNGEYFIHRPDAEKGRKKLGAYNTCHIDQVYGQSWAFQVGLGRILDKEKTMAALKALWKYNFKTDVGPYIKEHTGGRPYALPGDAGMIMNTNPANEAKPYGEDETWQLGYFHECMSGFEHQVASHLMAEGMTDEALVLTRAIHDRYHAFKRNPFNEIECSDHYARAMASYGTFISACGFTYHGPKGLIGFAPAWNKDNFKAPFVTAAGWGTYDQKFQENSQAHRLHLKYGTLQLQEINLQKAMDKKPQDIQASIGAQKINLTHRPGEEGIILLLDKPKNIQTGQTLLITIQY